MKYLYKYTPEIVLFICLLAFLGFKSQDSALDRMINRDGKGYYAYLPAIFIYHDLQFDFTEKIEAQYYPGNPAAFKDFRTNHGTRKADKYFPGMAIIWLPFFLLAHLFAWLEVFPMDGYSFPYQYSIALSALFFLWLGARWLQKLLKKFGSNDRTAAFITATVTLGTNLLYFTVIEPSMTHVYSFALITGFAYFTFNMFHDFRPGWFVKSLLLFTLIILIRPVNGLIVLLIPFLAGNMTTFKNTFRLVVSERKALISGIIQMLILVSIPIVLWYLQTGKAFIYSYGNETFDFLYPSMLNILFSYNRGWFMYTPVALVSLFGFAPLFIKNRFRFYMLAGFMLLFVYVASCWWIWFYNSQCGQRVFIDIYVVVALLLLFLYQYFQKAISRQLLTTGLIVLIALNFLQFYQHSAHIFPTFNITGAIYRDSFFSLTRKAKVYIPAESIAGKRILENDMEGSKGLMWLNPGTRNDKVFHNGQWSSEVNQKIPYSVGLETQLDSLFTTNNRVICIRSWVFSPREVSGITLVVDFQLDRKSLSYNQFMLDKFISVDKWTPVEVAFYVPRNLPRKSMVKVYFFNPSLLYEYYIDDLAIDFLSLKNNPGYRRIDGVNVPEKRSLK